MNPCQPQLKQLLVTIIFRANMKCWIITNGMLMHHAGIRSVVVVHTKFVSTQDRLKMPLEFHAFGSQYACEHCQAIHRYFFEEEGKVMFKCQVCKFHSPRTNRQKPTKRVGKQRKTWSWKINRFFQTSSFRLYYWSK